MNIKKNDILKYKDSDDTRKVLAVVDGAVFLDFTFMDIHSIASGNVRYPNKRQWLTFEEIERDFVIEEIERDFVIEEVWEPKTGDTVWYISECAVEVTNWSDSQRIEYYVLGVFKTRSDAEQALSKILAVLKQK